MKINVLLIGAFLTGILMLGIIAYAGVNELDAVKTKIAISTASGGFAKAMLSDIHNVRQYLQANTTSGLVHLFEEGKEYDETAEMWLEALIYGTDSAKFRESDAYKRWVKGGYEAKGIRINRVPEISKLAEEMKEPWELSEEVCSSLRTAHQDHLAAKAMFDAEYPKEKNTRYVIREIGFASSDPKVIRATGNMLYHNKEALFQYGDKKHIDEWFADIQTLKTTVADSIAHENKSLLLKYLDEYSPIARTMANLTLEMKRKEAEESSKLEAFHVLKDKVGEKMEAIDLVTIGLANEATMRMIRNMAPFVAGVLGLVCVMVFFVSRSISTPITKLTHVVDEISRGKLDATIEKSGNIDEVNKLEESLERVLTTMKRSVKRLDEKKDE